MNLDDRVFFRMAVGFFIASLILPADGQFFAGIMLFVFSSIASVTIIFSGNLDMPNDPKSILGLSFLLMPFYNVLFLFALTRFWKKGKTRFSVFRVCLYVCTIDSLISASMGVFSRPDVFYLLALWALAFLFMSLAVAVRTEKNLTSRSSSLRP